MDGDDSVVRGRRYDTEKTSDSLSKASCEAGATIAWSAMTIKRMAVFQCKAGAIALEVQHLVETTRLIIMSISMCCRS